MANQQITFNFETEKNACGTIKTSSSTSTSPQQRELAERRELAGQVRFESSSIGFHSDEISGRKQEQVDQASLLDQLRQRTGCIQHSQQRSKVATFSTGVLALDDWLPVGGLKFDAITEWVSEYRGGGATTLAFLAAASRLKDHTESMGPLVVVSEGESFYPPSAIAFGIPAHRILWVRTRGRQEQIWAVDQALRCKSIAAVLALLPSELDDRDARRFQLASEQGKTPGFFVRPRVARGKPCFAEVRFHVDSCQRKMAPPEVLPSPPLRTEHQDKQWLDARAADHSVAKSLQISQSKAFHAIRKRSKTERKTDGLREFSTAGDFKAKREFQAMQRQSADSGESLRNRVTQGNRFARRSRLRSPVSLTRQFQITLDRCRGGQVGRQGRFEMNDFGEVREVVCEKKSITNHGKTTVHLVSELAHPENSKSKSSIVDCAG